jgi:hypothetical protein
MFCVFSGDECHVTIGFCTPSFVAKWNQLGTVHYFLRLCFTQFRLAFMDNLCLFLFSSVSPLSPFMPENVEAPAKHIKY